LCFIPSGFRYDFPSSQLSFFQTTKDDGASAKDDGASELEASWDPYTTALYDCTWNDADWEDWDGSKETMPDQGR